MGQINSSSNSPIVRHFRIASMSNIPGNCSFLRSAFAFRDRRKFYGHNHNVELTYFQSQIKTQNYKLSGITITYVTYF